MYIPQRAYMHSSYLIRFSNIFEATILINYLKTITVSSTHKWKVHSPTFVEVSYEYMCQDLLLLCDKHALQLTKKDKRNKLSKYTNIFLTKDIHVSNNN